MLNLIILIFVGGAFGAMCREFVMLSVPRLADGFPMDIFVVNIVAAFLLGVATSRPAVRLARLRARQCHRVGGSA